MKSHAIRRLNVGEAELYRAIRLEALRESPEAFGATYEGALARGDESWVTQADEAATGSDRAIFIAITDQPVGLAALYRDAGGKGVGELIQVWVAPEHRGGPVAGDLIGTIHEWASRNGFETIRAEVTPGNPRALRFYEKHGFTQLQREGNPGGMSIILTKNV